MNEEKIGISVKKSIWDSEGFPDAFLKLVAEYDNKEDSWNLADEETMVGSSFKYKKISDIKTFIQKTKEKFDKRKYEPNMIKIDVAKDILDELAGRI